MTKRKWLVVLLAVLLAAAAAVFLFGDDIAVYIAPKTVLSRALKETVDQLQQCYSRSPVSIMGKYLDPDGCYTAQMELETQNDLAGEISYDMTVRMDGGSGRLFAEGLARTSGSDLDLSVYLDREFMALSSDDLLNGAYYGITYETFPSDIRSIPLLKVFISEQILSGWDASVANIQVQMSKSYRLPDLPDVSEQDIHSAIMAVLLLPSDVERAEIPVWGVYTNGHKISYSAAGEQVREVLGYLMDTGDGEDASVSATFYLYDNQIIMVELQGEAGGNSVQCSLELMCETPDILTFRMAYREDDIESGICIRHSTKQDGSYYNETWKIYPDFEAAGEAAQLSYRWEPVMGELVISQALPITLNLMETEEGLRILTDNFERLTALLTGQEVTAGKEPVACTMTLQTGSEIATPDYKNLDDWSLEDLLVLMGGIGSLIGLEVT